MDVAAANDACLSIALNDINIKRLLRHKAGQRRERSRLLLGSRQALLVLQAVKMSHSLRHAVIALNSGAASKTTLPARDWLSKSVNVFQKAVSLETLVSGDAVRRVDSSTGGTCAVAQSGANVCRNAAASRW